MVEAKRNVEGLGPMATEFAYISVQGKTVRVPAMSFDGLTVIVSGRWIKRAAIKDEAWLADDVIGNPDGIIAKLKTGALRADVLTFSQKLPSTAPRYRYPFVWSNVAAIPLTSYTDWWEKRLPQVARKNVRRAEKRGITVRKVAFNDALIEEIVAINNETPIRQGRPFWHYGKSFDAVKRDYSDFEDRSEYLGAYYQDELVGFMRLVYIGKTASILQLLCKNKHYDKRPANALIAKAVGLCIEKGFSHLSYGQFVYGGNSNSMLTDFKRRNGFEQVLIPTYHVPLTVKGWIYLKSGMHLGIKRLIPKPLLYKLLELRSRFYHRRFARAEAVGGAGQSADLEAEE